MKRTLTACLLLAGLTLSLLLAFPTPASARETRTILKNGDFSSSEKYWNFWTQDPANGKSKLVKDGVPTAGRARPTSCPAMSGRRT